MVANKNYQVYVGNFLVVLVVMGTSTNSATDRHNMVVSCLKLLWQQCTFLKLKTLVALVLYAVRVICRRTE